MNRLVFDIETDGLYDNVSKIHSLVIQNTDTKEVISCTDNSKQYIPVKEGLELLSEADCIIGHNITDFDVPVIKKLFPSWEYSGVPYDTLLMARLYKPDIRRDDIENISKGRQFPKQLIGKHSLEAWGYRVGVNKGEYGKREGAWSSWSEEMQRYCEQDVKVTDVLFTSFMDHFFNVWGKESYELERSFADIISEQVRFGFCFNEQAAVALWGELAQEKRELEKKLKEVFLPVDKGRWFTPKANNSKRGYVKGRTVWVPDVQEFNPSSRAQIAEGLLERGWKPETFTDSKRPKVDEEELKKIDSDEARTLIRYLMLDKRIGQIATGEQAWLKSVNKADGRIHGSVTTNGAVTGRCTHHHPNVAQVPAVGAEYGAECRALWGPPPGYYQLGCDASGLELRCLAHYITPLDGGAYMDVLLNGDIHTANQKAAGLETRAEAKRFVYAYIYGAGDALIGGLFLPYGTDDEKKRKGMSIKRKFLNKNPALRELIHSVKAVASKRGYLLGLDKRRLHVRSEHSALNLLLQSAGALLMKKATAIFWEDVQAELGCKFGAEVAQMAHIHDEFQLAVRNDIDREVIGALAIRSIKRAGEYFSFRCPLDGEYKTGANWAETH
jgi:DNA polymerase I-like protein with 3'-5' exonuclease and polymerase domains